MKIAYITAQVPWGRGETFILDELLNMKKINPSLIIVPRNPTREVFHDKAKKLVKNGVWIPLLHIKLILFSFFNLICNMKLWTIFFALIKNSRTVGICFKNIAVFPKGVYLAKEFRRVNVEHIHVHWGSTTATIAYIISELTGLPWSMTLHRWDISENNMLNEKARSASFIRCISQTGKDELLRFISDEFTNKVVVLHVGVNVLKDLPFSSIRKSNDTFTIACPANLVPVKGHTYLIEAVKLLVDEGYHDLRCNFIGDGPLEGVLKNHIKRLGLEDTVVFCGRLPNEEIMQMYENGQIDVVVLPSIVTETGEQEGIPVALMEAMSYGIPVISTKSGGIPELLDNGAGILIEEKNPIALSVWLEKLLLDEELVKQIGLKGYKKVKRDFDVVKNTFRLSKLIEQNIQKS